MVYEEVIVLEERTFEVWISWPWGSKTEDRVELDVPEIRASKLAAFGVSPRSTIEWDKQDGNWIAALKVIAYLEGYRGGQVVFAKSWEHTVDNISAADGWSGSREVRNPILEVWESLPEADYYKGRVVITLWIMGLWTGAFQGYVRAVVKRAFLGYELAEVEEPHLDLLYVDYPEEVQPGQDVLLSVGVYNAGGPGRCGVRVYDREGNLVAEEYADLVAKTDYIFWPRFKAPSAEGAYDYVVEVGHYR